MRNDVRAGSTVIGVDCELGALQGRVETRKPLVMFVAPYFSPRCYGGVVQVYFQLITRSKAFRFVVVSDRRACEPDRLAAHDQRCVGRHGYETRRINSFELHFTEPRSFAGRATECVRFFGNIHREWDALVHELRPDLVICGGTFSAGWLMGRIPAHIPLVNYVHGEELTLGAGTKVLQPYFRYQQVRTLRRAALNIAVSRYTANLIQHLSGVAADRIVLLPNFIDPDRFRPPEDRSSIRADLGWTESTVVLSIARLEPRKGLDQALRALALLHNAKRIPDNWLYVIGGRGPEEPELARLARELHILHKVRFLGFVDDARLADLYGAADVFIQPNRAIRGDTEGFGIVFLEANACGTPVIAGTAGGTEDAVDDGNTGRRVNGDRTEEIAEALESLLTDPQLRTAMGRKGHQRVIADFTIDTALARFQGLLQQVYTRQHLAGMQP